MIQKIFLFFLISLFFVLVPVQAGFVSAQENSNANQNYNANNNSNSNATADDSEITDDVFYTGQVLHILEKGEREAVGYTFPFQRLQIKLLEGPEKGKLVDIEQGGPSIKPEQWYKEGDTVVVGFNAGITTNPYFIIDPYRIPAILFILGFFFLLVIFFGRLHGFNSILGLGFSILVLAQFIIPNIVAGQNPLLITFIGSLLIVFVSIYLAHGLNRRTTIAVVSTLITLVISVVLSYWFVSMTRLFGLGSEESFYLQFGALDKVDPRGLLLSGIIIGTLGILDDITTAQSAAVAELREANASFGFYDLYKRGLSIGKEHIASLVNTLALAYAGASLPVFLIFTVNASQPLWVILNSEFVAEEIIRALVGSTALLLAVPITTFIAARYWDNRTLRSNEKGVRAHRH